MVFDEAETCFFIEGEVIVTPDGEKECYIGKGDLVTFPQSMSCTWKVHKPVRKYVTFG